MNRLLPAAIVWAMVIVFAGAQDWPRGQIIDSVQCVSDATQTYALYLPSTYTPDRAWPLLMGFHPGARGRAIVEKYRAAAERYGYVVAASNNSRNGPWEVSARAVNAMARDLGSRFSTDPKRLYATGHSGGARVALQLALMNPVAGVIASSAGFPDRNTRSKLNFVLFGTAGDTDFNYIEMKMLDQALKSPHRLVIFDGGHTLPPDDVAMEAIEWMELQAIRSGIRPKDDVLIGRLWEQRLGAIAGAGSQPVRAAALLHAAIEDFTGLLDVSKLVAQEAALIKDSSTRRAIDRQRSADRAEMSMLEEVARLEAGLANESTRNESLAGLRGLLESCRKKAGAETDSPERMSAQRVLRIVTMGAAERVTDARYLEILKQYRPR